MSESLVLRTENLVKRYGKRTVANQVSINVKQGEIVGLLGPNGAGKTTSFYMIVGLIKPNSGKIFLQDEDITQEPMYKRAQKGIRQPAEMNGFTESVKSHALNALIARTRISHRSIIRQFTRISSVATPSEPMRSARTIVAFFWQRISMGMVGCRTLRHTVAQQNKWGFLLAWSVRDQATAGMLGFSLQAQFLRC